MRASDRVYEALRADIVALRLPPGTELGEVELAARLGVSRTPVREALSRLAADGLAVAGRGRTLVVSPLDATEITHLFQLREALETQAARLAARSADRTRFTALAGEFAAVPDRLGELGEDGYYALTGELDAAVDAAIASPHLARALRQLRVHVARARRLSHDNPDRLAAAAREHALIAKAVADGDETLAAQATAVHLHASLAAIRQALAAHDAPAEPHPPRPVPTGAAR